MEYVFEKTGFDYVNDDAEVIIVGITPGNNQLEKSRDNLNEKEIKRINAFAGNMRPNLISMLDYVGINTMIGIESCKSFWNEDFDRVEMTSLLKEATYEIKRNKNKVMFKDTKKIETVEKLNEMFLNGFVADCKRYTKAKLFVACGPGVFDILTELKQKGVITAPVIAIPHPSGANMGRISAFLGKATSVVDGSYLWAANQGENARCVIRKIMEG